MWPLLATSLRVAAEMTKYCSARAARVMKPRLREGGGGEREQLARTSWPRADDAIEWDRAAAVAAADDAKPDCSHNAEIWGEKKSESEGEFWRGAPEESDRHNVARLRGRTYTRGREFDVNERRRFR